jgi:hypothetical protein
MDRRRTRLARFLAHMREHPTAGEVARAIALAIVLGVAGSALLLHGLATYHDEERAK